MAPVGEDMAHADRLGIAAAPDLSSDGLSAGAGGCEEIGTERKSSLICLALVFVTNGIVSLAALYLLWQVDGNYFLLLYALSAILAVITAGKIKERFPPRNDLQDAGPVPSFNMTITAVSNWGGTLGLTPVKIFHKGYYNHMEESHELLSSHTEMRRSGTCWRKIRETASSYSGNSRRCCASRAAPRAIRTSREAAETSICHPARRHWQSSLHSREWIISISEADT